MFDPSEALRIVYQGKETLRIEYKQSMPWKGTGRFKLIRSIVGLANTGGGYLVIGYNEGEKGDDKFEGMKDEDIINWDVTNVARDVNNYVQPDIDLEVLQTTQTNEKEITFVVVRVPPHGSVPHICIKDAGDNNNTILRFGALYYRNRNKEITEISRIDDWQDLVQRITMQRKSEIQKIIVDALSTFNSNNPFTIEQGVKLENEIKDIEKYALELRTEDTIKLPLISIASVPLDNNLEQNVVDSKSALMSSSVDYRGWPFIFYIENSNCPPQFDEDSIWAVDTEPFYDRPNFYYWNFKYTKSIFYSSQITGESAMGKGSDLDAYKQSELLAEALISIGQLYLNLGYGVDTHVEILVKYMNLSNAKIMIMGNSQLSYPYIGTSIILKKIIFLNELHTRPWSWAAKLISEIGQRMGTPKTLPVDYMEALARKHLSSGQKQH